MVNIKTTKKISAKELGKASTLTLGWNWGSWWEEKRPHNYYQKPS